VAGRSRPDLPAVDLQHPDRALLARSVPADQLGDHVAVGRERRDRSRQLLEERDHVAAARSLRQLVPLLERDAEPLRRGFERLHRT
jgi:hypothetical protein